MVATGDSQVGNTIVCVCLKIYYEIEMVQKCLDLLLFQFNKKMWSF